MRCRRPRRGVSCKGWEGTMSRAARPEVVAFLADMKEHPDDPTPRLVLADWLEEHGDEADRARAEYLRLGATDPRKDAGTRQNELWERWHGAWLDHLAAEADLFDVHFDVRGGLIQLRCTAEEFLRFAGQP